MTTFREPDRAVSASEGSKACQSRSAVASALAILLIVGIPSGFGPTFFPHGPTVVPSTPPMVPIATPAHRAEGTPELDRVASAHAPPTPTVGGGVNPYRFYNREPAPVGEADYGIDAADTPSSYSTPIFYARLFLDNIATQNASLSEPRIATFQLNVNLYFTQNSTVYVYWIQDVLEYNTSSGITHFLDNVWNASGLGTQMLNSSITGLGTVTGSPAGAYYFANAGAQAGNVVTLQLPTEVDLQVVSETVGGAPGIAFEFQDGFGWQGFDTVSFPFAVGAVDSGFVVDGFQYRPDGAYLDAEVTIGGPGGGSQTKVDASSVNVELLYWNGHNLQAIVNAYNFGSDTAEGVTNLASTVQYSGENGTPAAALRINASAKLGPLFDRADVGIVNISTSVPAGALFVNGTFYGAYQGGQANLTVGPGNYTFSIYDAGFLEGSVAARVTAGAYVPLQVAWHDVYFASFITAGLPSGIIWSVTLNGTPQESDVGVISYLVPPGSYGYIINPLSGFVPSPASGTVNITNAGRNVTISWSVREFQVSFIALGLPSALEWSVVVAGTLYASPTAVIVVAEAPGTYAYSFGEVAGFHTNPTEGSVDVIATNLTLNVTWTRFTYVVDFVAQGLSSGLAWGLAVESNGVWVNSSGVAAIVGVPLPNGSFEYAVTAPAAAVVYPPQGAGTVVGKALDVVLVFSAANGYLAGTITPVTASLWVDNVSVPLVNGSFNTSVSPGEHEVRASAAGYESADQLLLVAAGTVTPVHWDLASQVAAPTSLFSNPAVLGAVVGLGAIAVAGLWFWRRRRTRVASERPVVLDEP
ncbi:MAG: thermopsin [Thermoplasmata archaeon]|nr:thermopsin [Thermoplasmata archaeon]